MTVQLEDIISYCDNFLKINRIPDSSLNGLQVEGENVVEKIALGVSVNLPLFKKAKNAGCQLIIVHHGMLWDSRWRYIRNVQKQRLKFLFDNNLSLAGYHLPLDLHPEIGNNAVGLKKLGVEIIGEFGWYKTSFVGYFGKLKTSVAMTKFKENVSRTFGSKVQSYSFGKTMVETVAFVSGGGRFCLEEAIDNKIDCFITGETGESAPAMAEEAGINIICAGHYNTEKFGVMELGKLLENKFKVKTEFIDVPNNL